MSSIYWFMEIRIICKDWTHIDYGIGLVSYTKQRAVSVIGIDKRIEKLKKENDALKLQKEQLEEE